MYKEGRTRTREVHRRYFNFSLTFDNQNSEVLQTGRLIMASSVDLHRIVDILFKRIGARSCLSQGLLTFICCFKSRSGLTERLRQSIGFKLTQPLAVI